MKSNKIITANDWRSIHPHFIPPQPSDIYYSRICTKLLNKADAVLRKLEVDTDRSDDLALLLGFYIEDLVSGTHVFDAFRNMHMKMYGRKLPFYNLSPHYDDEYVNIEDIKFMIWDYVQTNRGDEAIINPDNVGIEYIAHSLYPILCDAYEEAPEVTALHDAIFSPDNYTDFVESKKVLFWLLLNNPMTATFEIGDKIGEEMDSLNEIDDSVGPGLTFYFLVSQHIFTTPCQWLSVYAYQWLSQMLDLEGMSEEAKKIAECRHTGIKTFNLDETHNDEMILVDATDGDNYRVSLDSFNGPVVNNCPTLITDLATLDGTIWECNGLSWHGESNNAKPDTITDGKVAYDYYTGIFGGRIAYFKNLDELKQAVVGDVNLHVPEDILQRLSNVNGITAFVNSNGSLSLSPTLTYTTPDPANPYFNELNEGILLGSALNSAVASSDMARYYHAKGWYDSISLSSSISPKRGHDLFHDNFDFLLRYFRGSEYHTS